MILYRPMVAGDIPGGLSLCRAAGWNQTSEDWGLFLQLSPMGCYVAVDGNENVTGAVATVRYEERFSWIGMVLVDPAHHRRGIGTHLMRKALQHLQNEDTVKLDATPAGRHVYAKLAFVDEYPFSRMALTHSTKVHDRSRARMIEPEDLPAILTCDVDVFGAPRESVIKSVFSRGSQLAWLSTDKDGMNAYCFGRSGHNYTQIGPVIAKNFEGAKEVASAALATLAGKPVVLDALRHSPEWLEWLTSLGFVEQRSLTRMYRGVNAFPGKPERQYAILGPEFG